MDNKIINYISVDVEEYFHAENLQPYLTSNTPSRVEKSIEKTLELFDKHNTKATFFVLGKVAKEHRNIIKKINDLGHEIASHGMSHKLVYNQTEEEFFEDIHSSKILLEDIISKEVIGYRAPNFSITDKTTWGYKQLIKAGYRYDSSIYPIKHSRYSNLDKKRSPYKIKVEDKTLIEIPLATFILPIIKDKYRFPIAGGAYWRLLPLMYNKFGINRINNTEDQSAFCYFHPWELDANQPKYNMPLLNKVRHYSGTNSFDIKIDNILSDFDFDCYKNYIVMK